MERERAPVWSVDTADPYRLRPSSAPPTSCGSDRWRALLGDGPISSPLFPFKKVCLLSFNMIAKFYFLFVVRKKAPCGTAGILDATNTPQLLSSPNYPAAPGANLRCRWVVQGNTTSVQLHFQQMDVGTTAAQCANDRIEVEDIINVWITFYLNLNLVI